MQVPSQWAWHLPHQAMFSLAWHLSSLLYSMQAFVSSTTLAKPIHDATTSYVVLSCSLLTLAVDTEIVLS